MTSEGKKPASSYLLTSSDNPGNIITQVQLKGDNYDEWARAMRTSLRAKKKFGFIDGTINQPDDDSTELEDWWTVNSMLVSWMLNTIEPTLRSTITYMEIAKDLWEDIKERFSIANGPRVQQIKAELANCKQRGLSIVTYYGKLKQLWEELANYEQIPMCHCGRCNCNIAAELDKKREEERLHQFLMGLEDALYGAVRSNILSTEPLPNLNKAYSLVCQEERVRNISRGKEEYGEVVSFAVQTNTGGRKYKTEVKDKSVVCSHCKREGHDSETCFQLIGYPEWWGDRPKGAGRGRGGQSAGRGRSNTPKVNTAHVIGQPSSSMAATEENTASATLTAEQWSFFLNLLNTCKPGTSEKMNGKDNLIWIIDSGASQHMTGTLECLTNLKEIMACPIGLPNGEQVMALKEGSVCLGKHIKLDNVLYVPNLNCNLISVSQLLDGSNCTVQFTNKICVIQDRTSRMVIGAGEQCKGLYYLKSAVSVQAYKTSHVDSFELWHRRMGHPSAKIMESLPQVEFSNSSVKNKPCDICLRAKQTREVFVSSDTKANEIFELIHCDLWGPYRVNASCGASYFLTIVDDFSRGVWIYLLTEKTEVELIMRNFFAMTKRQFQKDVKIVRSDNGTEFAGLHNYFSENGILHQTSCVGTPQQNGRVERKHRHILNVARALRFQANLPIKFWGECVLTAGYLINRTPSKLLGGKTPYEILFGRPSSYNYIRTFGCLCYARNLNREKDKFASRSQRCLFVGYPFGKKGWKVYDLDTGKYFVSRDVVFSESEFPYADKEGVQPDLVQGASFDITNQFNGELNEEEESEVLENSTVTQSDNNDRGGAAEILGESVPEQLGRGHRTKEASTRLRDYVTYTAQQISPSACSPNPILSTGTSYPIAHYVNCDKFSPQHRSFLAAMTAEKEPASYVQAIKDIRWKEAMMKEIEALEANGTWTVEDLPQGKRALGSKWVYKIKYNSDGSVERYKARLVILGNNQIEGIDYNETFAPVAKMVTVRTFLSVAAAKGWELHQMDVHNAFLHGDLEEEVYMKMPPGFSTQQPGKVCRLRKSLYGLRQAPRCWFSKLTTALKRYGFLQSQSDYSLFTLNRDKIHLSILVYVDDLVLAGNNGVAIQKFKDYLCHCFHMKDLGTLKYFLGVEVARNQEGIFLCQRKYALDIISEAGLLGAKPSGFPIEQNHHLALAENALLVDSEKYRRLVGRLIYLTLTRPELSYSVHILAQFMHQPREAHWEAALRVVRYLKGSPGQGILLRADSDLRLYAYCDSDWGSCPLTRRSLTGYFVMLGTSPISWKTKKQHTVSRSSAEAEYRSMATTVCELKWLKGLLLSLGVVHSHPMLLYCDSQAALHISANPVFHERTKHIEIDCHFIRDEIQHGYVQTAYVRSSEQIADIFTKALGTQQFGYLLRKLGVCNLHAPT